MLAKGVIDDMKNAEEIIGSDVSAGISILKRRGSSRRTNHVELKVFFLQAYFQLDYVEMMKCKSEDMLSDSLTKVMTMPKHHVQRCGLKDIQIMMVTAMAMQCGLAEAKSAEEKYPGSEWFVLQAAAIVFLVGLFTGMLLMKQLQTL